MKKIILTLMISICLLFCWIINYLHSDHLKKLHVCFVKGQDENACMLLDYNMGHSTIFSHDWEHRHGNLLEMKRKLSELENKYKSASGDDKEANEMFFQALSLEKNINDMIYLNCNHENIIQNFNKVICTYLYVMKKNKIDHVPDRLNWLIKRRNFFSLISENDSIEMYNNIIYSESIRKFHFVPTLENDCKLNVENIIDKETSKITKWNDIKNAFINLYKEKSILYIFRIKNSYKCVNKHDILTLLKYIKNHPDDNDALYTIAYYFFWEKQAMSVNQNYAEWKLSMEILINLANQGHKDSIDFLNLVVNKKDFNRIMEMNCDIRKTIDSIIAQQMILN